MDRDETFEYPPGQEPVVRVSDHALLVSEFSLYAATDEQGNPLVIARFGGHLNCERHNHAHEHGTVVLDEATARKLIEALPEHLTAALAHRGDAADPSRATGGGLPDGAMPGAMRVVEPEVRCPSCGVRLFGDVAKRGACLVCFPELPAAEAADLPEDPNADR